MKTKILTISLIAIFAIVLSSCKDVKKYEFNGSEIEFNIEDDGFPVPWQIKEKCTSGDIIKYYFEKDDIHNRLESYKIEESVKNGFNCANFPQEKLDSIMRERAKVIVFVIDSINKMEIESRFKQLEINKNK